MYLVCLICFVHVSRVASKLTNYIISGYVIGYGCENTFDQLEK